MDNNTQPKPLPEKVLRRHLELLKELLPELNRLVIQEGRPADTLLNHYLRSHRELGSRDRRFLSQAVFSYFRWYGWTITKMALEPAEACLLGVMLDTTESQPSFEYIQTQCEAPAALEPIGERSVDEKREAVLAWYKDLPDHQLPALTDLLPAEFEAVVDPLVTSRCISEFQHRPPAWIRSRGDLQQLTQALAERNIPFRAHDRVETAISVDSGTSLPHQLKEFTGQYIVQDISSQSVAFACAPSAGQDWWDCCAGAGGKTLHLMDLMQQNGKILASDVRPEALKELKKRARRYGIRNIRTQPFNAATDEPFTKTFDGVVVDAPCSGWGTWGRNPDARWRTSQREVVQCANRQLKILNNAVWCVKPGGVLVYAVCTFTRPETEEVVMNFLDLHPHFKLDPFVHPLTGEPTCGQQQIWPWDGPGDAMFIARFVRDEEA
jgi:16S rRNA (cytosine967-C5)-methyltransferase